LFFDLKNQTDTLARSQSHKISFMKKLFTLFLISFLSLPLYAAHEHFQLEPEAVQGFESLEALEKLVKDNGSVSYTEIKQLHPEALVGISDHILLDNAVQESPLGIPSFLWGCVLGWVGILLVYLISEDRDETKKALYGCITTGVVVIAFYVVYVLFIIGSFGAASYNYP
jgi:hypothetical protein